MTTFAQRLLTLRTERGMTLRALASRSGIPVATLNRWERGMHVPDLTDVGKIAAAFNLTVPELLEPVYARDEPPFPLAVQGRTE